MWPQVRAHWFNRVDYVWNLAVLFQCLINQRKQVWQVCGLGKQFKLSSNISLSFFLLLLLLLLLLDMSLINMKNSKGCHDNAKGFHLLLHRWPWTSICCFSRRSKSNHDSSCDKQMFRSTHHPLNQSEGRMIGWRFHINTPVLALKTKKSTDEWMSSGATNIFLMLSFMFEIMRYKYVDVEWENCSSHHDRLASWLSKAKTHQRCDWTHPGIKLWQIEMVRNSSFTLCHNNNLKLWTIWHYVFSYLSFDTSFMHTHWVLWIPI